MPVTTLSLAKFTRVRNGTATEYDKKSFGFVKNLLTKLTQSPQCDIEQHVSPSDLCNQKTADSSETQNFICKEELLEGNQLKNIFDFIAAVIDGSQESMTSEIEKLFKLCCIFLNIDLSTSELNLEQQNALNAAYIGLLARIANFPNVLNISNKECTNYKIVDLLNVTNHFFEAWAKLNIHTEYSIFEILKNYTESVGNLTRNGGHEGLGILPIETVMGRLIILLKPYLNADQKKILMYNFAHEYKSGDELSACKEVFNTTDCDPYSVTKEFQKISLGSTPYNNKISVVENLDIGLRLLKKLKFDSESFKTMEANTKSLNNFSQYFKVLIKKTNDEGETLPEKFTEYLCEFLSYQFKVFKGTDTLLMSYRSSFSLFLALLKNPSAKNNTLINDPLKQAFNPMKILLNSVLENSSKNKTLGILSTLEIFADMVHLGVNDAITIAVDEKQTINENISELVNLCFKIDECPKSPALDQFFASLGSMVRNLAKKTQGYKEKTQALTIQQTTQQLIEDARNNSIPLSRIENFAYNYLYGCYNKQGEVPKLTDRCSTLFNLTHCQPAQPINRTEENHTDFTIYKTTSAIPAVNTTLVSATNQTFTPVLIDNKTTSALPENVNYTFSNQTIDQTTPVNNSDTNIANPGLTLGASAAHGVGSGMINGIIQYFATKYSRQGEQSSKAKAIVIYSSLLAHAALAATFPMMLYKIQEHINQGNEDEAQQLWDVLLLNALPTFISSVVTNCGYHLACEFTQLFSNRFHTLTQNLPLLATACNLYSNPMETGVHLATSFATSSLTYIGLNKFFPAKSRPMFDVEANSKVKYDVQKNAVEMQPLNPEKNNHEITTTVTEKTPQEIFFKKARFTTSEQFDKLKQYMEKVIEEVEKLKDKLNDQIHSDRLDKILQTESQQGLCYDLIDLKNFPNKFKIEYDQCENEAEESKVVKNNLEYFKTMIKTIYDKLLSDNVNDVSLKDILFSIENNALKQNILDIIASIKQNVGFIRTIIKPIISIHINEPTEPVLKNGTAILFRQGSKVANLVNNRHTYHANNDCDSDTRFSSASEEGSTLSTGSSKDGEDIQINRFLLKP